MLQVGLGSEQKMSINYVVLLKKEDVESGKAATLQKDMSKMTEESSSDDAESSNSSGVNFLETLTKTLTEVV